AHLARRRLELAGEQVEERGLPRAVGPDDAHDLAAAQVERDVVDGGEPAEPLDHATHAQEQLAHAVFPCFQRWRKASITPAMPRRMNKAASTMTNPRMMRCTPGPAPPNTARR